LVEYITKSSQETSDLGEKISAILSPNDVVLLYGDLGAGKTTLIQGIAKGLGIKDYITSPTFILINEYHGKISLYHLDLYRLNNSDEIENLGLEEYFGKNGICLIEWAEKLGNKIPSKAKTIRLKRIDDNSRKIITDFEVS